MGLNQTYNRTPRPVGVIGPDSFFAQISYMVNGAPRTTAPIDAGRYPVTATVGNISKKAVLTIAKAPLYVTPNNQRVLLGQPHPTLTAIFTGLFSGDSLPSTAQPVLKTTAKANSPGGSYFITASKGKPPANYFFVYRRGILVIESFAGKHETLAYDANAVPVGKASLVLAKTGSTLTGRLYTDSETSPVSMRGSFTLNEMTETADSTITGIGRSGAVYTLTAQHLLHGGDLTGTIHRDLAPLAPVLEGRRLLAPAKGWKAGYAGAHTVVFEPAEPIDSMAVNRPSGGVGHAVGSISSTGSLKLVGKLPDGTAFTTSLSPDTEAEPGYRLFVQPYKPARIDSSIGGDFFLLPHPLLTNRRYHPESTLFWRKVGQSKDPTHRAGITPSTTVMLMDPWIKPSKATSLAQLLGLTHHQSKLTGANLHVAAALVMPSDVAIWNTQISASRGALSGSITRPDGPGGALKRSIFSGVLRQPISASDSLIGAGVYILPGTVGAENTTGEMRFER